MKKRIINIILAIMVIISITACSNSTADNKKSTDALKPLSIGVLPDVDSIPFIIAQHNGYFSEEGLDVKIEPFKSAIDRDTALQTGNIDGVVSDMLAAVFLNDNGFKYKITSKTDGSYKLIAGKNSNITDLSQINGRTLGLSKNTIIEYLTDRILINNKAGNNIEKVAIPKIPTRLEMLQNGKLDMATLPEPLASVAISNGGKILSSSNQLDINPGVMIFTNTAIETKNEEIKALYKAYNKAVQYLQTENKEKYIDIIIKEAGFPEDVKDTLILPEYTMSTMPNEKELTEVIEWLRSKNLTKNTYSLKEISDDSFIK